MNIFYTDSNPHIAANQHCNIHQVKMIVEYTQLLSTAHHVLGCEDWMNDWIYKETHTNHPSAVWVRESSQHYTWLFQCLMQLHRLYSKRTDKIHASYHIRIPLRKPPNALMDKGFVPPPQCMPEEFRINADRKGYATAVGTGRGIIQRDDHVQHAPCSSTSSAYQSYLNHKFDEWLNRARPLRVEFTTRTPEWRKKHVTS